jgi:hypothetical protein
MNCKNIEIYLDALMDNELSVEKSLEIIDHVDSCKDCKTKWELSEGIKSKLVHYTNSLKVPSSLKTSIYKKYGINKTPLYVKQSLIAAGVAFLLGLGLFTGSSYMKIPALNELHEKTKLQLVTSNINQISRLTEVQIKSQKFVNFEKANFKIEGATRVIKPFNKSISIISLKNNKGQKIFLCFLPENYSMPGCHEMKMNGFTIYCGKGKDCHFAYWKQKDKTIAVVGDSMTSEEMVQLAMPIIQEV